MDRSRYDPNVACFSFRNIFFSFFRESTFCFVCYKQEWALKQTKKKMSADNTEHSCLLFSIYLCPPFAGGPFCNLRGCGSHVPALRNTFRRVTRAVWWWGRGRRSASLVGETACRGWRVCRLAAAAVGVVLKQHGRWGGLRNRRC